MSKREKLGRLGLYSERSHKADGLGTFNSQLNTVHKQWKFIFVLSESKIIIETNFQEWCKWAKLILDENP